MLVSVRKKEKIERVICKRKCVCLKDSKKNTSLSERYTEREREETDQNNRD